MCTLSRLKSLAVIISKKTKQKANSLNEVICVVS